MVKHTRILLSVFDHFADLSLKGLIILKYSVTKFYELEIIETVLQNLKYWSTKMIITNTSLFPPAASRKLLETNMVVAK